MRQVLDLGPTTAETGAACSRDRQQLLQHRTRFLEGSCRCRPRLTGEAILEDKVVTVLTLVGSGPHA